MRLHLVIHRRDLPVTRLLWSTPVTRAPSLSLSRQPSALSSFTSSGPTPTRTLSASTSFNTAYTSTGAGIGGSDYIVSQLLVDVNDIVPLEAIAGAEGGDDGEQWPLHDYVVEVMGSECLHFMRVDTLLREGDEVVIRPLEPEDIATRMATGRRQITPDGTHLIDGVPFGKQRQDLKRTTVSRPSINMPPMNKRRRLGTRGWNRGEEADAAYPTNEEALDATVVIDDVPQRQEEAEKAEEPTSGQEQVVEESQEQEQVVEETQVQEKVVEDSQEEDVVVEDEQRLSPAVDGVAIAPAVMDIGNFPLSSPVVERSKTPGRASQQIQSPSLKGTNLSEESSSESSSEEEVITTAKGAVNAPGHGTIRTKRSNLRTKWRRKLLQLKTAGILDKNANFDDMRAWEKGNGGPLAVNTMLEEMASKEKTEFEKKREQLLRDLEGGGVEVFPSSAKKRKHEQLSSAVEMDSTAASTPALNETASVSSATAPTRQSKLDLAGTRRLLFGSLGVKAPKTKQDEEHTRNKLAQTNILTPKSTPKRKKDTIATPTKEIIQPVENWQDRIILKATECVYDDIELSTPPFPFVQRWDPDAHAVIQELRASQAPQGKKRKNKKRKRQSYYDGAEEGQYEVEYDQNGDDVNEDITLDYGDGEVEGQNKEVSQVDETQPELYQPNGEITDSAEVPKTQDGVQPIVGDLPPLPTDISTLPDANKSNLWPGAIFAFKQLDLSKATNWQPQVSHYRTAIVENVSSEDTISFRLAKRDRDRPDADEVDDDKPRRYTKFEMPGFDEKTEEDDGLRDLEIGNLIEAKLISAAARETADELKEQLADLEDEMIRLEEEKELETLGEDLAHLGDEVVETQNVRLSEQAPPLPSSLPDNVRVSSPTRREISQLMRDAGFRSAVNSDLVTPIVDDIVQDSGAHLEDNKQDDTEETVREQSPDEEVAVQDSVPRLRESDQQDSEDAVREQSPVIESPKFAGFDSDQPPVETAEAPAQTEPPKSPSPLMDSTVPETAKLSPLSALENWISANGSTHGSDREKTPRPAETTNEPDISDDDDSDGNPNSLVPNPFYDTDRVSDEDYAGPTIDDLFAESTPCAPGPSKLISSSQPAPAQRPTAASTSPPPMASSQPVKVQHAAKSTSPPPQEDEAPLPKIHETNDEDNEPSASQIPDGSMVVDLTLSSDPAPPGDEDYEDDSSLFHGPGWVAKRKPKPRGAKRGRGRGRQGGSQRGGRRSGLKINRSIV
ncbi:clumping factor B [Arthroderma uncinatum]|uniref:clumping factor B n=1 Tax=Arthroderma uncinatum TaxID=74035 RepID=UPI00144AA905|nr:clumping factor B [Arthroderma uncinatum]KAF3484164.1 clumping factor B [Arthroderma uncinatum]